MLGIIRHTAAPSWNKIIDHVSTVNNIPRDSRNAHTAMDKKSVVFTLPGFKNRYNIATAIAPAAKAEVSQPKVKLLSNTCVISTTTQKTAAQV